jgi:hypothetical protein
LWSADHSLKNAVLYNDNTSHATDEISRSVAPILFARSVSKWFKTFIFGVKLDLQREGTTILRNVSYYSPNDTASHPTRLECSFIKLLTKPCYRALFTSPSTLQPTTSCKASHPVSSFRLAHHRPAGILVTPCVSRATAISVFFT